MTTLPDWLVERAALDEVPPASRGRIDRADPRELADRIAQLRAENAAELASHPAGPAVAEIESRVLAETRRIARRRRTQLGVIGMLSAAAAAGVLLVVTRPSAPVHDDRVAQLDRDDVEDTRAKGLARLVAYRQAGERVEHLDEDTVVRAGDRIQIQYRPGGQGYGVIASVDGAGVVTLHYPKSEDAPPAATALAAKPTALPHAYALDDAPRFERFFFITGTEPIDVQQSLAALRTLASRPDSATASLELPAGLRQWSLRLRKPEHPSSTQTP